MSKIPNYKILLLGECNFTLFYIVLKYIAHSGKEYIKNYIRYIKNKIMTCEFSSSSCLQVKIKLHEKMYNLNIWDLAGEEKYPANIPIFYRGAHGALIIFDTTNREAFKRTDKWFIELKEFARNEDIPKILVGFKTKFSINSVSIEEATNFVSEYNCKYFEFSENFGTKIDEIFYNLIISINQRSIGKKIEKIEILDRNLKSYDKKFNKELIKYINF